MENITVFFFFLFSGLWGLRVKSCWGVQFLQIHPRLNGTSSHEFISQFLTSQHTHTHNHSVPESIKVSYSMAITYPPNGVLMENSSWNMSLFHKGSRCILQNILTLANYAINNVYPTALIHLSIHLFCSDIQASPHN